ncbi:unnamed protein product [Staurois parvus]|uniref:Uncharacterized protein n=1 Tax=Staurois parvus TaxID=386267 RepID=A0ABN9AMS0_9NEOB|nr:unnamed protein product [Staurois parvus]
MHTRTTNDDTLTEWLRTSQMPLYSVAEAGSDLIQREGQRKWLHDEQNDEILQELWRARPLMFYKPGLVQNGHFYNELLLKTKTPQWQKYGKRLH